MIGYVSHTVLCNIQYKPGWALQYVRGATWTTLWWSFIAPDYTKPGAPMTEWQAREWRVLNDEATEDSLVKTALAAALQAEEHECREAFTYKGVRLFDPHLTVQKFMEAACPST